MTTIRRVSSTQVELPVQHFQVVGESFDRVQIDGLGRRLVGAGSAAPTLETRLIRPLTTAAITLTNFAAADAFLNGDNAHIHKMDLAGFTQARLLGRVTTGVAASGTIQLRFRAGAFSTTVAEYLIMGATSIEISCVTAGLIDSGWINLVTAAKANGIFVAACMIGGDGAADPVVTNLVAEFR